MIAVSEGCSSNCRGWLPLKMRLQLLFRAGHNVHHELLPRAIGRARRILQLDVRHRNIALAHAVITPLYDR